MAKRRLFWVAALVGIIVFGTLMGTMYIGQQFLQNVLGYSTLASGASVIPMSIAMVAVAALSARMVGDLGSRVTLMVGYLFFLLGFVVMLMLWGRAHPSGRSHSRIPLSASGSGLRARRRRTR